MCNQEKYIRAAKKVIKYNIISINKIIDIIDYNFCKIIDAILESKGKIVIGGVGKSGHIGKKISSTFSSIGTASFFIHPNEASHGDLGMIGKDDIVILISNSGETKELIDVSNFCKKNQITVVSILGNKDSFLSRNSKYTLILPDYNEANRVNAPIVSSTLTLIIGDIIAVSLMEAKEFRKSDYSNLHPGGKIGNNLSRVEKIMRSRDQIALVSEYDLVPRILLEMTSKHLGCAGVINENKKLIGSITDGDIRRHAESDFLNLNAKDVMTKNPITINKNKLASEAMSIMRIKSVTSIFVTEDDDKILGIIHIHDCLRADISSP